MLLSLNNDVDSYIVVQINELICLNLNPTLEFPVQWAKFQSSVEV